MCGIGLTLRIKSRSDFLFYDKLSRKIYDSSGDVYTTKELINEFKYIYAFLIKFMKDYNDKYGDFLNNIENLFYDLSRYFKKIGRSGIYKDRFNTIKFDWEN